MAWVTALALLFSWVPGTALAQDSHYWNIQYGTRSLLLGGSSVGSASDLSAVYYNPGRLALVERPELLLSGTVFELTTVEFTEKDGSRELLSTRFALSPSLVAGELRFGFLGSSRLSYSFLTRQQSVFDFQGFLAGTDSSSVGLPPGGVVTDSVRLDHRLTEYWGGITWARPIGDRFGIGISTFVASRNHRGFAQRNFTAVGENDDVALVLKTNDYKYSHWRIVWKLGAGTRLQGWDLGTTLTLPGVSLGGSGRVAVDDISLGVSETPTVLSLVQQDLEANYESPLSVAAGGSRTFGESRVHLTVEWFAPLDLYNIIEAQPVQVATGDTVVDPSLREQAGGVVNAAVGFEHRFNAEVTGYTSLSTDQSSAVEGSLSNADFTQWNILHLASGATFSTGSTDFTLGLVAAFGTSQVVPQISAQDFNSGYRQLTLILGFSFPFGSL